MSKENIVLEKLIKLKKEMEFLANSLYNDSEVQLYGKIFMIRLTQLINFLLKIREYMDGNMTKKDYIDLFNALNTGSPVSWKNQVLPIIYDYLTESQFENSDKMINLIKQNPQLSSNYLLDCIKYYCRKHGILSIIYNNKTILYYE